jgi:hypothetical protein
MTTAKKAILIYTALVIIAVLLAWNWEGEPEIEPPTTEATWQSFEPVRMDVSEGMTITNSAPQVVLVGDKGDITNTYDPTADIVYTLPDHDTLKAGGPFTITFPPNYWECKPVKETP